MMERIKANETTSKKAIIKNIAPKDFQKAASKTKQIQTDEQENALSEFLERKQIPDSVSSRQKLKQLIAEGKSLDNTFSFEDLSDNEINQIKNNQSLVRNDLDWQENKSEAQTIETLIDTWKGEDLSQYEIIQKLLNAHETGKVKLLTEKYKQFKQFFALLESNQFGAKDTQKIVAIINDGDVDLSNPKAFEQMVFTIFEDESISEVTKQKIGKQFKLIPIVTGDDLRTNLLNKHRQITKRKNQSIKIKETLVLLEDQTKVTKSRLAELKEEIIREPNYEKRRELEQRYDELEELLKRLEKGREAQEITKYELEREIPNTVTVRGAEAEIIDNEIIVTLPDSITKVSVPLELGSEAIGKAVNAYLVNETMKEVGLESYFFYQSDFETGSFPDPTTLSRNNLLLFRLGLSNDGIVLKNSEIKQFKKQLSILMDLKKNRVDMTLRENAKVRMFDLGLLTNEELNHEAFAKRLNRIKRFGRLAT